MSILVDIIMILAAIVVVLVLLLGAMYVAIIAYHEARWKKIKSENYEQYNQEEM